MKTKQFTLLAWAILVLSVAISVLVMYRAFTDTTTEISDTTNSPQVVVPANETEKSVVVERVFTPPIATTTVTVD